MVLVVLDGNGGGVSGGEDGFWWIYRGGMGVLELFLGCERGFFGGFGREVVPCFELGVAEGCWRFSL